MGISREEARGSMLPFKQPSVSSCLKCVWTDLEHHHLGSCGRHSGQDCFSEVTCLCPKVCGRLDCLPNHVIPTALSGLLYSLICCVTRARALCGLSVAQLLNIKKLKQSLGFSGPFKNCLFLQCQSQKSGSYPCEPFCSLNPLVRGQTEWCFKSPLHFSPRMFHPQLSSLY